MSLLIEGLKKLEYRGYDSAGVAVMDLGQIARTRSVGKISALEATLAGQLDHPASIGIAHTRWATHGPPTEYNAHPHMGESATGTGPLALVCNGIIENYQEIKASLIDDGYEFTSDTDTEVLANEIHRHLNQGLDLREATRKTLKKLEGAYAIALIHVDEPRRIIGARSGSPLVVGIDGKASYLASDMSALLSVTRDFYVLNDGDLVDIQNGKIQIFDAEGTPQAREVYVSSLSAAATELGNYSHYMEKEIYEQRQAVVDTLEGRISGDKVLTHAFGPEAEAIFARTRHVQIIACGTSYHAGLVGQLWFEHYGIPCRTEIASEYRSRTHAVLPDTLVVTLSQSGETIDTLYALRTAMASGCAHALSICNVPESSLVRESELSLMTHAGPEIGVASTKAFTTQLVALLLLVVAIGKHARLTGADETRIVTELRELPRAIERTLEKGPEIARLAERFSEKHHALFLGRGTQYPIAMEGALKLKEISYIHAEAYAAGELKHGPLALVDNKMPVVAVAPNNQLLEKLKSNIEEVRARGGQLIVFADTNANINGDEYCTLVDVAPVDDIIAPIVYTIPLQLLAYHVALIKGTDVDKPRNLAKSVTVE